MKTKAETFWGFLSENSIVVPLIQRDYAQGRKGKERLRETFLCDLKKALDEDNCSLTLDFVYGTKNGVVMTPLDGQQRLTTLWLLHWYLAYRSGSMTPKVISILKRFKYASRISSREFCGKLSEFSVLPPSSERLVKHIENQTWFRRQWRNDPTIQAMLGMLGGYLEDGSDGVERIFDCNYADCFSRKVCSYKRYWEKLIGAECPITFYYLDLQGLRQTDTLYIKMNARGKPLTSFENFKADLIGYINKRNEEEKGGKDGVWGRLSNPKTGFAILLDTEWTNKIFWPIRISKSVDNVLYDGLWDGRIDDIIFAFFNRYCANEYALSMSGEARYGEYPVFDAFYGRYLDLDGKVQDDDARIVYAGFENYKKVLDGRLESLCRIFNAYDQQFGSYSRYEGSYEFIPHYKKSGASKKSGATERFSDFDGTEIPQVDSIKQKGRIAFLAFCNFFANEKLPSRSDLRAQAFRSWMRVAVNIIENSDVNTINSMNGCLRLINEISEHSHDILSYLKSGPKLTCGTDSGRKQVTEEIEKARKILGEHGEYVMYDGLDPELKGKTWESVIDKAEQQAFFRGAIRFMYRNRAGLVDWSEYDIKWKNIKRYFGKDGVSVEYRKSALLLRALLARIDASCIDRFGNGEDFWRNRVLLDEGHMSVVAELLTMTDLTDANLLPKGVGVADWICDKTLLEDAVKKDGCPDGEWHIVKEWRKCARTLTRYDRKEKGNVNHPGRIIPLDLKRNELMAHMESDQRRGEKYYIGWDSDIDFKYKGSCFRWYGTPDYKSGEVDVYLMTSGDYQKRPCFDEAGKQDVDNYYCFDVQAVDTQKAFKVKLEELITAFSDDFDNNVDCHDDVVPN